MNLYERRVVNVLKENGPLTTRQLAEEFNLVCQFGDVHRRDELTRICRDSGRISSTVDRQWCIK